MIKLTPPLISFVVSMTCLQANATELTQAQSIQDKTHTMSANSQTRVDKSVQTSMTLKSDIEQLQQEIENLTIYRQHLAALVENQQQEKQSLNKQIDEIQLTRQGVVPLMYKMLDGLKTVIEKDKPLQRDQRIARLKKLESLMVQADVSDAEKYRRILEAYQIEIDYGSKLGQYAGEIVLPDAQTIEADIAYVGRLALIARNQDHSQYWSWDDKSRQWLTVNDVSSSELDKVYDLASNRAAPSLLRLPVSLSVKEAN